MPRPYKYLLFFLYFVTPAAAAAVPPPAVPFERGMLAIHTAHGDVSFAIEIAKTADQQRYGLMNREVLRRDEGMLFVVPNDNVMTMWMEDTKLPLDMLFIDRHGRIVYIAEQATPYSHKLISAGKPVRAVMEVLGGTAELRGIHVGDQVIHPYFQP